MNSGASKWFSSVLATFSSREGTMLLMVGTEGGRSSIQVDREMHKCC